MKLNNVHLVISAFAALAGVLFAAIQTFGSGGSPQAPVSVTLAVDPAAATKALPADQIVQKSQDADAINTALKGNAGALQPAVAGSVGRPIDIASNGRFLAAFKDGSADRYAFKDLFDGRPETSVTIDPPDSELNVLVEFGSQTAVPLTQIDYTPAPDSPGIAGATSLDVMVLPEGGTVGANGGQVMSYALQTEPGRQTFLLPADSRGMGLWLRIGGVGTGKVAVGDFKVFGP